MKQFFTLIAAFICLQQASAQVNTPVNAPFEKGSYQYYQHRSQNQKIAGLLMAGTGLTLVTVGVAKSFAEMEISLSARPIKRDRSAGETMVAIGGGLTLASIPFLVSSIKNRHRARLILKEQQQPVAFSNVATGRQAAVGLQITF